MHRALQKLGWEESRLPRQYFLLHALQEARDIVDDEKCVVAFIAAKTGLFATPAERKTALELIMLVLEIDGMDEQEDTFLARVTAALED